MNGCRDCVKGHCDEWSHLIATVIPPQPIWEWDLIYMTDSEVQRCPCGGTLVYGGGRMKCNLCGSSLPTEASVDTVSVDVGKTLNEVLIQRRRSTVKRWTPSDDDVKVTVG